MRYPASIFILLLSVSFSAGQNLENLKDQPPVTVSGNVSASIQGYSTSRERASRLPFIWTLSGNPTLSIYGVTLPFSFVISRKNEDFRQPFNQFGVSPYYKWLKLHLGYRSLSFSQYSLNGHVFNGIGAEATPGKWRFGAMYGRLLRPIEPDSAALVPVRPTYLRRGYSMKVGYGTSSNYVDLVLLKGWDEPGSIRRPTDSVTINPQQNLVLALKTQQRLFSRLTFNMDVGLSGWTSNLFAEGPPREDIPLSGIVNDLLNVNYSTQFLTAGRASLAVRVAQVNLRLQYQRVDPDYQTMGAYFFNNDLENITFSPSWSMFKRKVRVNGSVGWQRNNLREDKTNQTNRRINSLQVSYVPIPRLTASMSFTNFQINQQRLDVIRRDVIDSLQLEQFSNNLSLNVNYNFGDKVKRYSLSAGFNRQSMSQEQNNEALRDNDSRSLSPTFSFRYNNKDTKWGYRASFNLNDFENSSVSSVRWGVALNADKKLADDKLMLNASGSWNQTSLDGGSAGTTIRTGLRCSYNAGEKHTLSGSAHFIQRASSNDRIEGFNEFLGSLSYNYAF